MRLIPERKLHHQYPLTWTCLDDHRLYLWARADGKMNHEGWHGYGRTPDIAQRASYSLDPARECFFSGGAAPRPEFRSNFAVGPESCNG